MRIRAFLLAGLMTVILSAAPFVRSSQAQAVSPSQWQPGYIIDDSLFFFSTAMGANDIQTFLSSKVPTCDTNGTQPISQGSSTTRAQWAAANGKPSPPYTCLKNYTENVTPTSADSYCAHGISGGNKSAAMIIAEVGWACGVNPQVLLVLLQKEQGLVTDDWPWPNQYQFATGFCVYDSGPPPAGCEGTDGFFRQVYYAARQFQKYVKQPGSFNYRAGVTSNILWNVASTGCGGSNVYVQNGATAALYNYTPYQPNQASLNAGYGTGDGCSAYGNRNFWLYFNDWFGPTLGSLVKTPYDNTVYLLDNSNSTAHPISDANILNDYAALGPVRITSAGEINSYAGGAAMGNMVGDSGNSNLYLVNSSIKLPFETCQSVADYGYSCSQVNRLGTLLINKLANGPPVTPLLKAVNNPTVYYVTDGKKRPIPSWSEVQAFRIPTVNVLTGAFVNQIPFNGLYAYGPGSLVKTANSPNVYAVKDANNLLWVTDFFYSQEVGLGANVRTIASSYSVLNSNLNTKFKCSGTNYIGTNGVTYLIPTAMMTAYNFQQSDFMDGGSACIGLPISSQYLDRFIRLNNGAVFYVSNGQKQLITNYPAYVAHGGNSGNTITVSNYFSNFLSDGGNINN
jgi:hypothetical protein